MYFIIYLYITKVFLYYIQRATNPLHLTSALPLAPPKNYLAMQARLSLCRGSLKQGLQLARRVFSRSSTVPLTAEHYQIQRGDYSKVGLHAKTVSLYCTGH